jgi:SAM-dependent methyltransferase
MKKISAEKWSQLWNDSSWVNSFGVENYKSTVLAFWTEQLGGVTGTVIDMGCGNGGISWLANEILNSEENRTIITGIDYADIQPFSRLNLTAAEYPMLNFLGNTPMEELPFNDGTIDMAISQYGFEYANPVKAAQELSRVLKNNSRFCFIMHGKDSTILKKAAANITQYKIILNDIKLHDRFLHLDDLISRSNNFQELKATPEFISTSAKINGSIRILKQIEKTVEYKPAIHNYLQSMAAAFSEKAIINSTHDRRLVVLKATQSFRDYLSRIDDLHNAALSLEELDNLENLFRDEGFKTLSKEVFKYKDSNNHGYVLSAVR